MTENFALYSQTIDSLPKDQMSKLVEGVRPVVVASQPYQANLCLSGALLAVGLAGKAAEGRKRRRRQEQEDERLDLLLAGSDDDDGPMLGVSQENLDQWGWLDEMPLDEIAAFHASSGAHTAAADATIDLRAEHAGGVDDTFAAPASGDHYEVGAFHRFGASAIARAPRQRRCAPEVGARGKLGWAWLACCVLLAGYFALAGVSRRQTSAPVSPAARAQYTFSDIERIHVGQRVLTDGPPVAGSGQPTSTAVDSSSWRLLRLRAVRELGDGATDVIDVETLQPPSWLAANHARVGGRVPLPLDLRDMNRSNDIRATVVEISPCPEVRSGPGRVVLTTVTSITEDLRELEIENARGERALVRPTGLHRFYSESRHDWIPAAELREGERLRGAAGTLRLVRSTRVPGSHRVYNMTVEGEHDYFVSALGALVHNDPSDCMHQGPLPPSGNRVGSTRHVKLQNADNGSYTVRFESGKGYAGKGGTNRARRSARQRSRANSDPVDSIDHTPAGSDAETFKQEAKRLQDLGGPESPNNYNEINSPGKKVQ